MTHDMTTTTKQKIESVREWTIHGDAAMNCVIRRLAGTIEVCCPERTFSRTQGYAALSQLQAALAEAMEEILELGRRVHGEAALTACHKCRGEIFVESFDAERQYYCLNTFHKLCHEYESDLARIRVIPKRCYRADCKRLVRGNPLASDRHDGRSASYCCTNCREGTGLHTRPCESKQAELAVEVLP